VSLRLAPDAARALVGLVEESPRCTHA